MREAGAGRASRASGTVCSLVIARLSQLVCMHTLGHILYTLPLNPKHLAFLTYYIPNSAPRGEGSQQALVRRGLNL